jgi:hypothetical protein
MTDKYPPLYKPNTKDEKRKSIEKIDILSRLVTCHNSNCNAFLLKNVLTPNECKQLIDAAENQGFYERGNSKMLRVMSDDQKLSDMVFNRIKEFLPEKVTTSIGNSIKLLGLNSRWRCGRYVAPQDHFHIHSDSIYHENIKESNNLAVSNLTIMIYLNGYDSHDGLLPTFTGGTTEFVSYNKEVKYAVEPEAGLVIVFTQADDEMLHRGQYLETGVKYILRSDAMYEFNMPTKISFF